MAAFITGVLCFVVGAWVGFGVAVIISAAGK